MVGAGEQLTGDRDGRDLLPAPVGHRLVGVSELRVAFGGLRRLDEDPAQPHRALLGDVPVPHVAPIAILSGADSTETNQWGHTYQFHMTVFLATAWTGELVTQTDESTDAGWFHPGQIPTPHMAIVETSMQLLAHYDRTGEFVAP
jgi:hypothetical protein